MVCARGVCMFARRVFCQTRGNWGHRTVDAASGALPAILEHRMCDVDDMDVDEQEPEIPEEQRTAYVLCESDDKNYDEIALITNVPVGTVRSRIFRARKFLMENIKI